MAATRLIRRFSDLLGRISQGQLPSAGVPVSQVTGLGGAATLNVGTASGTVAAGNDSRLTTINAVQLQSKPISAVAPKDQDVLSYNATSGQWEPITLSNNLNYQAEYSGGNLIYQGFASPGNATSTAAWKIAKYTYDGSNNLLTIKWAGGASSYTNIWDNRASLSYS